MANWLQPWHDFYLLIGGASATLLGLVFVAASIAGAIPNEKLGSPETRALWSVPIIQAFGRTLALAAFGLLPGLTQRVFGCGIGLMASLDLLFLIFVARGLIKHHRRVGDLVRSDWIWHVVLPVTAAAVILWTGWALTAGIGWAMYPLAIAMAFHLSIGVHNTWELMDFLVTLASIGQHCASEALALRG